MQLIVQIGVSEILAGPTFRHSQLIQELLTAVCCPKQRYKLEGMSPKVDKILCIDIQSVEIQQRVTDVFGFVLIMALKEDDFQLGCLAHQIVTC